LPPLGLVIAAAFGAVLLLVVATTRWTVPSDEHAYWLAAQRLVAGQPLYDPNAFPGTPYAYWYPPPLAQVLTPFTPFTPFVPDLAFTAAWTVLLLACLWYLADRQVLVALALIAFVPVAVELWYRNIHLVLAVMAVVALRRNVLAWVPAVAIKVTPVIAIGYLVAARRYRDAALVAGVGAAVLVASLLLSPGAWRQFLDVVATQAGTSGSSLVPIPFVARFAIALGLAVIGGRVGGRWGETMLVVGLVIGNPTLWTTAFSLLIALVPLWRQGLLSGPAKGSANRRSTPG
jgi:alpha-1,2-mannosyltransferase